MSQVICGFVGDARMYVSEDLLHLFRIEFEKNGKKMLTRGKVRYLRRLARRSQGKNILK